jgi:hypothetical protein
MTEEHDHQIKIEKTGSIQHMILDGTKITSKQATDALREFFYGDPNKLGAPPSRTFLLEGGVNPENRRV